MFSISQAPLLRLLMPYVLSYLLWFKLDIDIPLSLKELAVFFIFLSLIFWLLSNKIKRLKFFPVLLFCFLGIVQAKSHQNKNAVFFKNESEQKLVHLQVLKKLTDYNSGSRYFAECKRINENTSLKVLVKTKDSTLMPGDLVIARGSIEPLPKSDMFQSFNYGKYLENNDVGGIFQVSGLKKIGKELNLEQLAYSKREFLLRSLELNGLKKESLAIFSALILGDKSRLSPQQKNAFSRIGAMHLLAVSGLHVGLIFMILQFLLLPLKKRARYLYLILMLCTLGSYVWITGASPSVLRASLMLMVYLLSPYFGVKSNLWNAIIVSAFLILTVDPSSIFQLSFQLSYSALAGIILFMQFCQNFVPKKPKIVKYVINVLLVSFGAQMATIPFNILVFHQFPTYFLIVNLLFIPFAFLLISGGIFISILSFLMPQSQAFEIYDWLLMMFDHLAVGFAELPDSSIKIQEFKHLEKIVLIGLILCFFISLKRRFSFFLVLSLIGLIAVQSHSVYSDQNLDVRPHQLIANNTSWLLLPSAKHSVCFFAIKKTFNDWELNGIRNYLSNSEIHPFEMKEFGKECSHSKLLYQSENKMILKHIDQVFELDMKAETFTWHKP